MTHTSTPRAPAPVPARQPLNPAARRYIIGWAGIALALVAVVVFVAPFPQRWWFLGGVTLLVALAERVQLDFTFENETGVYTLIEVALTAALLLMGPLPAVVVATLGTALAQITRRSPLPQTAFAIIQAGAGMSAAGLVLLVFPAVGPQVAGRPVWGVVAGMIVYVALNLGSMIGVLSRVSGARARAIIQGQMGLTASMMVGQIATGVVLGAVWEFDVGLAPFVVAPAAAVYFAGRGATRTRELLGHVEAQRDQLNRIVDGASDGILLIDAAGTIQVWNPAMALMTGFTSDEVIGRPVTEVLSDDVRHSEHPHANRWLVDLDDTTRTTRGFAATLQHLDGTQRAVQESHAQLHDEHDSATGAVIVVRDVTRQQEVERLRSDFVATVSHELRSPLAPIRGYVTTLLQRGDQISAERQRRILEQMDERGAHLADLVEHLLLVTRRDDEWSDLITTSTIALGEVIAEAVARSAAHARGRDITVDAPVPTDAVADPVRVGEILDALLDNADRYTPPNSPIALTLDRDGPMARIRIIDAGPGIPRDRHEEVFQRFYRLEDSLTMRTGGVGLGLFISRQYAVAMGGTLHIELTDIHDVKQRGTTVVLHLPRP